MKCCCCDRLLNDFESTRKSKSTGEYLDMCNKCHSIIKEDVQTVDRTDLSIEDVPDDEVEFDPCVDYDRYNDEE